MVLFVNQESSSLVEGHPSFEDIALANLRLLWADIDTMLHTPFGEDRSDPADARGIAMGHRND